MAGRRRRTTVVEAPIRLEVDGDVVAQWSCSPDRLEDLAVGWLVCHHYVTDMSEVEALETGAAGDRGVIVRVRLARGCAARGAAERGHRLAHGCGVLHLARCVPRDAAPRGRAPVPEPARLTELFRLLFRDPDGEPTGGLHTAALTDGGTLVDRVQEVGRHNAVDKLVGHATRQRLDAAAAGVLLSSRISGEIAFKCVRAGFAWVASRSVPSTLAAAVADAAGMPLIGRAGVGP